MGASQDGIGRKALFTVVVVVLVVGLAALVAACGVGSGVGDGGAVSTQSTEASQDDSPATSTPTTDGAEVTTESTEGPGITIDTGEPTDSTDSTDSTEPTSGTDPESGSATTTTTAAPQTTMQVNVYFARGEKMAAAGRAVSKTQGSGAAAMRALLDGPTAAEKSAGMSSSIPGGTALLGLNIKNGVATVDLSKEYASGGGSLSMSTRLAQVVFTLTQFPTVKGVKFRLDGKPIDVLGGEGLIIDHAMTRADYEDLSPAILVESPTLGATVKSPLRVTGTANVFEAVFQVNVVDKDGAVIADKRVQATSGTGTRGTFDVTVTYPSGHAGRGSLVVFEKSAKDGSPINVVKIPVTLK